MHVSTTGWPERGEPVSRRRKTALLATPPALIASMLAAFRWLPARLGRRRGYFAGFLLYWLGWACTCRSRSPVPTGYGR